MDSKTEIAIYKCMAQSSEDLISVWKNIANAEVAHYDKTKELVWDILRRGAIREDSFGDATEVVMSIKDWRELCAAVNFGV